MKISEVKKEYQLQEWSGMLREQKESGLSVKQWCQERGLAEQIHTLNEKIAVMNARHFGRSTEKLETLPGQMNIFNSGEQNAIVACATKLTRLKISATNGHRPEKSCAGAEI